MMEILIPPMLAAQSDFPSGPLACGEVSVFLLGNVLREKGRKGEWGK
jgi:hypothetical protein